MSTAPEHLSPAIIAFIVEQCKQLTADDKQPVVLLTTGSFNPVHRQHVQMHKTAKQALQQRYPMSVVASVMSPSCDSYLRQKLAMADRSQSWLSYAMRCDLLNRVLEEEHGIFMDKVALCIAVGVRLEVVPLTNRCAIVGRQSRRVHRLSRSSTPPSAHS
jgi:hypothetical protein